MAHQTRLRKKGAPAQVSKREKKNTDEREQGAKYQNENHSLVTKRIRHPEPLLDNVIHTIMYAQCEGHREMLKNICCYVSSISLGRKKKKRETEEVDRFTQPKRCLLAPVSLWRTAPLVHRILSSERLIQLASQ